MNIVLPESLEPLVRRRVEEGGYASIEEYVRNLILADQEPTTDWQNLSDSEQQEVERINRLLLEFARLRATSRRRRCVLGKYETTRPRGEDL